MKILIILGPTATGKTDLGLKLAQQFNGELIACDSRQVYKGLDLGTGKEPGRSENLKIRKSEGYWEIEGIKIWMYDLVDPDSVYNAFNWAKDATKVIKDIESRGKLPIIVGGTGLYLKALLEGFDHSAQANPKLREELEKLSTLQLQKRVETHSPARWENLNHSDQNNPRRLIRIIELESMNPYIDQFKISNLKFKIPDLLIIGLTAPRPILNSRIDSRLDSRINQGLIEEGKELLKRGVTLKRMRELGLEYGCLADLLEEKISQEEFLQQLKTKIHQYAKRQMTWFKKEKDVVWFNVDEQGLSHRVEEFVGNWYNSNT